MCKLRRCRHDELATLLGIINRAARMYAGVIPADCWHDPYMPAAELDAEIAAGVEFWGCEQDGSLVGVMGAQTVREVELIRHAYVLPEWQRRQVGSALIRHIQARSSRWMLVGTWAAATWAIRFYERHGFVLVEPAMTRAVLGTYWSISERQAGCSRVLAWPAYRPQHAPSWGGDA